MNFCKLINPLYFLILSVLSFNEKVWLIIKLLPLLPVDAFIFAKTLNVDKLLFKNNLCVSIILP